MTIILPTIPTQISAEFPSDGDEHISKRIPARIFFEEKKKFLAGE